MNIDQTLKEVRDQLLKLQPGLEQDEIEYGRSIVKVSLETPMRIIVERVYPLDIKGFEEKYGVKLSKPNPNWKCKNTLWYKDKVKGVKRSSSSIEPLPSEDETSKEIK